MIITFVLVEPAVAENVGAVARALKTMGFDRLAVVNSDVHREPEARWLAHGSEEVLGKIEVHSTLQEAVAGADLVVGTTAKTRRTHSDYYTCNELPEILRQKGSMVEKLTVVFGREESGLTNEELRLCNIHSGIPMRTSYPSLNLSHAVMIYAWELSGLQNDYVEPDTKSPSPIKFRRLRTMAGDLLVNAGFDNRSSLYCRIMERLERVGDKDAGLIMSVCSKLEELLKKNKSR